MFNINDSTQKPNARGDVLPVLYCHLSTTLPILVLVTFVSDQTEECFLNDWCLWFMSWPRRQLGKVNSTI